MTAALVALVGILTGADLALTLVALRLPGLAEGNPLCRCLGRLGTAVVAWVSVGALAWGALAGEAWTIPIGALLGGGRAWVCWHNWRLVVGRLRW